MINISTNEKKSLSGSLIEPQRELSTREDIVLTLLSRGEIKTNSEMRDYLGCKASELRKIIHGLRLKGYPVCSDHNGYWLGDEDDIRRTIRHMRSRMHKINDAVMALEWCANQNLDVFRDQTEMEGE